MSVFRDSRDYSDGTPSADITGDVDLTTGDLSEAAKTADSLSCGKKEVPKNVRFTKLVISPQLLTTI